jgi:hypothetical protein
MAAVGTNAFNLDASLYTGTRNNDRGGTLVEKHREKIQVEMEDAAISKLQLLCPQIGAAARVVALRETSWNVEAALGLLSAFISQNEEKLLPLQKRRKTLLDQIMEDKEDGSSSDDGKKRSKKKRSRKEKKSKRSSKDKKPKKAGEEYGRFGIIRETDAATKSNEFIRWALDVRKVDASNMSKADERELFRDFMEDYNLGVLPHRKYYNLEVYEKEKDAKRAAKGLKKSDKKSAVNDEEELRRQRAEEMAKVKEQRMQEALMELKYSDKARDMKEQEMLRLQMQNAYKTGNKALAQKIMERLAPDEAKK